MAHLPHGSVPWPEWRLCCLRRTADFGERKAAGGDEWRWLHLSEEMDVGPAHGQNFVAPLQVNLRRFVVAAHDAADRAQVDHDGAVHLGELGLVEPGEQILQ